MFPVRVANAFGAQQPDSGSSRTLLGFYAGVLAIVETGCVATLGVLASREPLHYLVPYVLCFAALAIVGLVVTVLVLNVRDPTKLQLGEMSASEYIEYQKLTLGDSAFGESVERRTPAAPLNPSTSHEEEAEGDQ